MSTNTKKPVLQKPGSDSSSRFSGARNFAAGETETEVPVQDQVKAAPVANKKATAKKAPPLKPVKNDAPTVRENFDLEEDLSNQMRFFLANSRKFRSKRAFLTQCLIDGLKKYDGQ